MPYLVEQFGIYGFGEFQRLQAQHYQELYKHDLAAEKIKKAQNPETMLEALDNPDLLFFMLYMNKKGVGYLILNLANFASIEEVYIEVDHRNNETKRLLKEKIKEVKAIWLDKD